MFVFNFFFWPKISLLFLILLTYLLLLAFKDKALGRSKFSKAVDQSKKEIKRIIKKSSAIEKTVALLYDQYSKDKNFVALLGITSSLRAPFVAETWNEKNVSLKKKKNIKYES